MHSPRASTPPGPDPTERPAQPLHPVRPEQDAHTPYPGATSGHPHPRHLNLRRPRRLNPRLLTALAACLALTGGALLFLPGESPDTARTTPAPAPGAQAHAAVTTGTAAALPDLAALIGEREAFVRGHPGDAPAWAVLGAAYVERGRRTGDAAVFYPKAEHALRTSLRAARTADALTGLAALATARRDFRGAKEWGEAAVKAAPKSWPAYGPLIDAYTGLGDYKKARATLEKLMELHSGPAVQAKASAVYRDRGWREDAAAVLYDASARAKSPAEQAALLTQAGQLSWERGDLPDALRHFQEAVRLDPDQRAAHAGQGRTLAALGRATEAPAAYKSALAGQPLPEYALELGELYEAMGLAELARAEYERVRARVRQDGAAGVDHALVLGRLEADHGDPEAAVRVLRAEWRRQPGIAVADALGWALYRAGQPKKALWYASIATDGTKGGGVRSAPYVFHRGVIERELGKHGPARRHLADALRINPAFSPLWAPRARAELAAVGEPPNVPAPKSRKTSKPRRG
ncbi:tetratricopeptide repeat protein [Streptomyces roseirectus]|uniref:Tetratricopeptide repeat protein n=1 Tax=Streptomyces roseirectus TaxID=2768066 RepID=A0A7H0II20_9ACTN|nr:tetratricopeptide repeat protein [Streptomyces roseirectus]QNP72436.1 tetratricopeptide repeat protein [Streptomyces roseirectus]